MLYSLIVSTKDRCEALKALFESVRKYTRDFEFIVSAIFQNEIFIDVLKTVEGAKEVDDPLHKIKETEGLIEKQTEELDLVKRYLKIEYEKA